MSRLGKQPIQIPQGVEVSFVAPELTVKGPKGTLVRTLHGLISVTVTEKEIATAPTKETKEAYALWGTFASHINNMLTGVTEGFTKQLEIEGVGYRAEVQGNNVVLNVGYSHPVTLGIPEGITATVEKSVITLAGIDKEIIGQFAANIRAVREPEPYKGKGIHYMGEHIIRKQGKKAVS